MAENKSIPVLSNISCFVPLVASESACSLPVLTKYSESSMKRVSHIVETPTQGTVTVNETDYSPASGSTPHAKALLWWAAFSLNLCLDI